MLWEPERNRNSLSPHGIKAAEGHGSRAVHDTNSVGCPPMPDGILTPMTPLGAGRSSPYAPMSSRRPVDEPKEIKPPHDPAPHPYTPAAQKQQANTYAKLRQR
jgi:hypothetical protein